jgi:hypothetical protein
MVNNITFDKISDLTGQKGVIGVNLGGSARVRDSLNVLKNIKTGLLDVDNVNIDGNTIGSTDTDGDLTLQANGTGKVEITSGDDAPSLLVTGDDPDIAVDINSSSGFSLAEYRMSVDGVQKGHIAYDKNIGAVRIVTYGTDENINLIPNGAGKVGIGTVTPTHLLHINRTDQGDGLRIQTENTSLLIGEDADLDNYIRFRANVGTGFHFTGADDTPNLTIQAAGNIGIGTSSPNTAVILDLSSTSKAFRPPVMTTTERDAISSPAEGSVIYNTTTNVLNFHNGSAWAAV